MRSTSFKFLTLIFFVLNFFTGCDSDDETSWEQKWLATPVTEENICDLLVPAENYNTKEISRSCYVLYAPREGGRFTFNLSDNAYLEENLGHGPVITPLDNYTLYKFKTFEVTYSSGIIPEILPIWPTEYYKAGAYMSKVVENAQTTFDAGWGTIWGGWNPKSITFDIFPNKQEISRQYCIWYGEYSDFIPYISRPYVLVIIQE